jgi:CBS domain-containing protein
VRVLADGKDAATTTIREVMTPHPHTIQEDTPIEDALKLMRAGRFRRLPVVGGDDRLIGLLSLDDILDLLAEEFAEIRQLIHDEQPRSLARG